VTSTDVLVRHFEEERDPGELCELAKKLSSSKMSPRAVDRMCRLERTHKSPDGRLFAAYALNFSSRASETLVEVLEDRQEYIEIRAEAAEALGMIWGCEKRTGFVYRWVVSRLLAAMEEPEAEIRFWVAYALGSMRATQALPALQRLAEEDHRPVQGWWKVSEEAADAIVAINTRYFPDREPTRDWPRMSWH